ncbi:MAG: winged helix-turn-helix transcriptional regulator [Promethearchaeota archaeon]
MFATELSYKNEYRNTKNVSKLIISRLKTLVFVVFTFLLCSYLYNNPIKHVSFASLNYDYYDPQVKILFLLSLGLYFLEIDFSSYKMQFMQYSAFDHSGFHKLSLFEIFQNENRQNIIKEILEEPGIHYSKLLKKCNLQPGQLQWHIKVLTQYSVIRKEKIGRYLVFYSKIPFIDDNINGSRKENSKHSIISSKTFIPLQLKKSHTTMMILNEIHEEPGISASQIAHHLNLKRNTVKYHVDKLLKTEIIHKEESGRVLKLSIK